MSRQIELNKIHVDPNISNNQLQQQDEENLNFNENQEISDNAKLQNESENKNTKSEEQDFLAPYKNNTCYERLLDCLGNTAGFFRTWMPCICCCFPLPYFQNDLGNVALLEKFGRLHSVLKDGYHRFNPYTDKYHVINMKTQIIDLKRQIVLTKDNITLDIDTIVYYRIVDPVRCQYKLQEPKQAVAQIVIGALRAVCGEFDMQILLEKRELISQKLEEFVFKQVEDWGVYIEQAFIKDVIISQELAFNLSAQGKAQRLGEAKVISAQADVECAQMLREAADLLDSEAAMQIRYYEQLQKLGDTQVQKVLFLPINDKSFQNKKQ